MSRAATLAPIEAWFEQQGWRPLPFQRQCWKAFLAGRSGLIQVPTGSGKTYAAVMGPIAELLAETAGHASPPSGLRLLYLTPLRALSRDLALAIRLPIEAMAWPLRVGIRNGDTPSSERARHLRNPPQILITTPESLSVLLAGKAATELFGSLEAVVLDEWHELMGSKRGSQCELCLSWLRRHRPGLRSWAISATIGNLQEAANAAVGIGPGPQGHPAGAPDPLIITAKLRRGTAIRSLLPESIDGFPWAGHLGLRMHEELVAALDPAISTLLFTNTRNQAERWHQCLRYACPEMGGALALHHSAIDRQEREAIEAGVKSGAIRWVVCTSSLDLGVDFQPVERVVQIGSAKNLARLLQRAGRSAHNPGGTSQVLFLPTNALELLEVSAMRRGLAEGLVEVRRPPVAPLDVLLQHLTSLACGPGFEPERELAAVRSAWSFRSLSDGDWQWCIRFLEQGGDCLGAYPRFRKLERDPVAAGPEAPFRYRISDPALARLHRLNIGTITADRAVTVKVVRGARLGQVEESFVARLKPGDVFFFAGRQLEFVRLREMRALVKASTKKSRTVPAWAGGQMALSDLLASHLRREVHRCAEALASTDPSRAGLDNPELRALEPLLRRQADLSRIPRLDQFLVETCRSREGSHLFAYPFEGRFVHEGLGFLWAGRLTRHRSSTITVSVNDYGFELLAPRGYPFAELIACHGEELLDSAALQADLEATINLSEICRRRFRAIAQIAGLVVNGYPGQSKSGGQLQISAALLFDVFQRHEPGSLLLEQARQEVIAEQLELGRLQAALQRLQASALLLETTARPGPLAFPLLVERLNNNRMSSESVLERVQRLVAEARKAEEI
ncbi:ligase-associated DNA damage response DEXH box helicase [Synechococcus sp. Tobar12-5m-g]|uniref:ligase-associated DNA damage response DEXH box helicase n=1 Tax=unclassified Synechococcus TaxID=2626047 RepID=UPI0020CE5AF1|nr:MULTISPECIES: ligase-associated DNA damage response DEXH box helicase [unclassified Synechococcus]MCP9771692.1 ligase-associated DNA damage response DEXH box helicase [Synechococcus sp. Tobar12-5m-g]MCP9872633.1 ligase-associated DNA damage response DEXH box helicase [Synechococcus sp. Cruz CV-v-12]